VVVVVGRRRRKRRRRRSRGVVSGRLGGWVRRRRSVSRGAW